MHKNIKHCCKNLLIVFAISIFFVKFWGYAQNATKNREVPLLAVSGMVDESKLRELSSYPEFRQGQLVYADFARPNAQSFKWSPYLHLIQVGQDAASTLVTSFQVQGGQWVYNPQISPDGKQVLFERGGEGSSHSQFDLVFWDLKNGETHIGPVQLVYPRVQWSPDSRYVAYIIGGDIEGASSPENPLELFIYDTQKHNSRKIAQSNAVKWMSWAEPNTLFYSVQKSRSDGEQDFRADIYSANASGGTSQLVLRNGYDPKPSPNGQKMLFWGWPDGEIKNTENASTSNHLQLGLYLFDMQQQTRVLLQSPFSHRQTIDLQWLPDNNRAVYVEKSGHSPQAKALVKIIDSQSGEIHGVTTLTARDYQQVERIETEPQFEVVNLSSKGDMLFVKISEFAPGDALRDTEFFTLSAVNLQTGAVTKGTKIKTYYGFDWRS